MFERAFKNIDDVLRKEAGCTTELDYTEQTSWLLFLKYLDGLEQDKADEAKLEGKKYSFILDKPYRWESWAAPKGAGGKLDHNKAMTGDDLREFVNLKLFPYLHSFKQRATGPNTIEYKIGEIFGEIKNKVQSGYNLREIIEHIDELRFRSQTEKHELSHLYEAKIKNMGNAGRSCLLPDTGERMITAVDCTIVRFNPRQALPEFFNYYSQSRDYLSAVDGETTGTTRKRISRSKLAQTLIPVPPLPEQHRIVGILDEAFDGLATAKANAEKNLHNARALFDSHLQSVFTQRGKGRVEKRLDEVCTFSSGGTPSKTNSSYWSGEIPWVSGRDMKSTRLSDSLLHISRSAVDESSTRMAPAGTLLILVRGMGLAHGAQIAELMVPCTFNQDIRGIHPEPDLIPRYLLFALRDRINSSDNVLSSAAHGTLKIDSDELKSMMIPVLSRDHQQRIVTTIDSLSEETQRLEAIYQQKLAALAALKKSLLQQAFTGQL